jgi:hypothetical protein
MEVQVMFKCLASADAISCLVPVDKWESFNPRARLVSTDFLYLLPGPSSSGPLFVNVLIRATASNLLLAGMNFKKFVLS